MPPCVGDLAVRAAARFLAGLAGLMALFPEKAAEIAIGAERSRSGLGHKTVVIGDESWHYLDGGPEDAQTILLLHGFGGDKDNWTRFSRHLTEQYRLIDELETTQSLEMHKLLLTLR